MRARTSSQLDLEEELLRDEMLSTLRDTCGIKRAGGASDGMGGRETTWNFPTSAHRSVCCSIEEAGGSSEVELNGKIVVVGPFELHLPCGIDVQEADRVYGSDGTVYEITNVDAQLSVEVCRKCDIRILE